MCQVKFRCWRFLFVLVALFASSAGESVASTARVENGTLFYEASAGIENTLSISGPYCFSVIQLPCTASDYYFLVDENGAPFHRPPGELMSPGPGCSRNAGGLQGTQYQAFCPEGVITEVDVNLGDRNDWFDGSGVAPPMTVRGADGDDDLRDGGSNDVILSGPGNDIVSAKAGNDHVFGEAGDDTYYGLFCTREEAPPAGPGAGGTSSPGPITCDSGTDSAKDTGSDIFQGGEGTDTANFRDVSIPESLSADGQANDGKSGEADNIATDVENIFGGPQSDTLVGNAQSNLLDGGAGDDMLDGGARGDTVLGGGGVDTVSYSGRSAGVRVEPRQRRRGRRAVRE